MGIYIHIPEATPTPDGPGVVRRRWRIVRERIPCGRLLGSCDWHRRTIVIHNTVSGVELLGTLVHESIHACAPDLSESGVERIEDSVVAILLPFLRELSEEILDPEEDFPY